MKDETMPLSQRIEAALKRITTGEAAMRVPVEATDPDMVLADCASRIAALELENATLKAQAARDGADPERVIAWARDPNRKLAVSAFTEGPERQAAYWIEWAEYPLRAALAKAEEAFGKGIEWFWDPDADPTDQFERIGNWYYMETGYLRPGKDDSRRDSSSPENQKRFQEWCADKSRQRLAEHSAALAAIREVKHG